MVLLRDSLSLCKNLYRRGTFHFHDSPYICIVISFCFLFYTEFVNEFVFGKKSKKMYSMNKINKEKARHHTELAYLLKSSVLFDVKEPFDRLLEGDGYGAELIVCDKSFKVFYSAYTLLCDYYVFKLKPQREIVLGIAELLSCISYLCSYYI